MKAEGLLTVTDKRGGIILSGNIWTVLLVQSFTGRWSLNPDGVRVFIDGMEVDKPEVFEDQR